MVSNLLTNYSRLKPTLFLLPMFMLAMLFLFLFSRSALGVEGYVKVQKDAFFYLNEKLGRYPGVEYNLTQFGDLFIVLSLLGIFVPYAPKLWEALISGSLASLVLTCFLKWLFSVPRPAAMFGSNKFFIVGQTLSGNNSLPSGHSITVFTTLTVLLFGLMPQQTKYKILWSSLVIIAGLVLASTRVGVGAHYPLDVITGCIVGYISGLIGIFITQKYKVWEWFRLKKCYPVFILLFLALAIVIINRIANEHLWIFYLAAGSLVVSLYKMIVLYVKR